MDYGSEAVIANELGKFLMNGGLYKGSKAVLWSVVEKTALAEAEIEYHDHTSDTVHVRFPVLRSKGGKLDGASVVIWTTTPWTIPGNRAMAYGPDIAYVLVEVAELGVANGVEVPDTVAEDGSYYPHVPLFAGRRVYTPEGIKGDANKSVTEALDKADKLLASGRIRHSYPHSWRSKAPVIFRNAPQWFIAMDKRIGEIGGTLREKALAAVDATRFVPQAGYNRLRWMSEQRPDWCVARQRGWG